MKNLTIIAPCFNEEKNIKLFYERLLKVLKKISIDYVIYFVDDGSVDSTWEIIQELKKADNNVCGIKFSRNFGQQNAISAGIQKASSDYIAILDVDLQDPPELLLNMYEKISSKKINIVYGQRNNSNEKFFKKITSNLYYKLFNLLSDTSIPEKTSNFKLFDRKVLNELKKFEEQNPFYVGIIPWLGFKSEPVLFDRPNREHGVTGWSLKKMLNFSMDGFFSFSIYPMRFSFYLSIFMSLLFIFLSFYALISFFYRNTVPGWTSIFMIISFFNIIIFFILGLMSEYLGRIHQTSNKRPRYIIDVEI
tara:strand:- start:237 stop:1154 length:918 start_codon:yes stop_codon:yes gene_type:complete